MDQNWWTLSFHFYHHVFADVSICGRSNLEKADLTSVWPDGGTRLLKSWSQVAACCTWLTLNPIHLRLDFILFLFIFFLRKRPLPCWLSACKYCSCVTGLSKSIAAFPIRWGQKLSSVAGTRKSDFQCSLEKKKSRICWWTFWKCYLGGAFAITWHHFHVQSCN